MRRRKTEVYQISDAPKGLTDDVARRQRTYMITMSIRVALFLAAVLVPVAMVFRLLLMLGALVLPYIAVIYANGGRGPASEADSFYTPPGPRALDDADTALGASNDSAWREHTDAEPDAEAAAATEGEKNENDSGVGNSDRAEPAEPAEPVEGTDAVERNEPVERAQPVEPVEPAEPGEPV
jgi:hypothetical protein